MSKERIDWIIKSEIKGFYFKFNFPILSKSFEQKRLLFLYNEW